MAKLFEDFVAVTLGEALTAVAGGRPQSQFVTHLDEASAIQLRPDLVWFRSDEGQHPSAVMDAKYKAEKPEGFPNADLYQMLTAMQMLSMRTDWDVDVVRDYAVQHLGDPGGVLVVEEANEPILRHGDALSG